MAALFFDLLHLVERKFCSQEHQLPMSPIEGHSPFTRQPQYKHSCQIFHCSFVSVSCFLTQPAEMERLAIFYGFFTP